MTNQNIQPITAEQVIEDIENQVNQSSVEEPFLKQQIDHARQLQQNFRTTPVIGKLASLKKLIYSLNNSTFSQQFEVNEALLNLIEDLYQEIHQYQAIQNRKILDLEHRLNLVMQSAAIEREGGGEPSQVSDPFEPSDTERLEPPNPPSREELMALVASFPYWYQRIYLGRGVYTLAEPAHHEGVWRQLQAAFPPDLQQATVLDVGTNAGYFSLNLKRRHAGRVLGVDAIERNIKEAEACRKVWELDIEYRLLDAHDLNQIEEQFDIVMFTGILYHLKHPLQVLEQVGRLCEDAIVVETEIIAEDVRSRVYVRQGPLNQARIMECKSGFMKLIEKDELNGDPSNWWVPDTECVLGMLRTAGFQYFSRPRYLNKTRLLLIASKKADSILNLEAI